MQNNKLTAKQEAFCQAIADGKDQATAYRMAYDAEKMKDNVIYIKASELMSGGKVTVRVAELKAHLAEKHLWTRSMSVLGLMKAFGVAENQDQAAGMTGAVKELNAMHGFNAPSELSVTNRTFSFSVKRAGNDE